MSEQFGTLTKCVFYKDKNHILVVHVSLTTIPDNNV